MMSLTHTLPRNLLSTVGRTLTTRNVARRVQACSISTASQASHRPGSPASPFVSRRPTSLQNPACPTGVRHKSKRSRASAVENVDEPRVGDEDVPVMNTKGKGAKAAKSGSRGTKSKRGDVEQAEVEDDSRYQTSTKNDELPDEKYHEEAVKANMRRAVERCKNTVTKMIGMQGRADPALLDSIRVWRNEGEKKYPLKQFATVGTRDGDLLVHLYDPDMLKYVERAIYQTGLTPQKIQDADEAMLRIPVPRPTAETRSQLLKDVSRICENARVSIRSARQIAMKQIKRDTNSKVIGTSEGQKELKRLDEETKFVQKQIDDFLKDNQKKIESEMDS